ncbi:hypothetical protein GCM10008090_26680 [Arenicella chitinivorans]|uniref:Uncharacterized protein n=1 Tax=Arenicella chitinivorans TaxID=1329800 RepID=A0A918RXW0_9GAMM|nr:hypothetical protein [Arenicella chitinivorans]GHA15756.1 hypothetical protein GCM10008090_26680 [Arenicella chitinivorans]
MWKSKFGVIAIAGMVMLGVVADEAHAAKKYRIYGDKVTGSRMRPVEVESLVPFDKTYDELNSSQKKAFRSMYGVLKETEHPPYPVSGTEEIYRALIKANKLVAVPGKLFLVANVNAQGSVENVAVYNSPDKRITEIATNLMLVIKFKPAECNGAPCAMEFPFEMDFRELTRVELEAMRRNRQAG